MSIAIEGATLDGEVICLRVDGGLIAEAGPDVKPVDGDEIVDGRGTAIVAGFVNGHTHAAMTLFRGYADDLPLMEWLQEHIWPAEAKLTAEDVYWGTRLACVEMIRTGTVRFSVPAGSPPSSSGGRIVERTPASATARATAPGCQYISQNLTVPVRIISTQARRVPQ